MIGLGVDPTAPQCSRAGCGERATTSIHWRNPKIHTEDRVKVWLACEEHVDYLREFLEARSFPVTIVPFAGDSSEMPAPGIAVAHGEGGTT